MEPTHLKRMKAILLLLAPVVTAASCLFIESLGYTEENFILMNSVIRRQRVTGVLSCAHLCLGEPNCVSFNYRRSSHTTSLCELSNSTAGPLYRGLVSKAGWIYGEFIRSSEGRKVKADIQVTFTNLGAQGHEGPTDALGYKGTSLEGKVKLDNGIQIWAVPVTGTYSVEAWGASGGNGTRDKGAAGWTLGGKGARIKGYFKFKDGDKLKILVGQEGQTNGIFTGPVPGGGGGGTFVVTADDRALVIAGGGGGGAALQVGGISQNGDPGQATENGTRHGGYSGSGGKRYPAASNLEGAAGGGFLSDGEKSGTSLGGFSFINGGLGGRSMPGMSNGGFGGGGAATSDPGGGGGYSGGGVESKDGKSTVAGGGGSYNCGASRENLSGERNGNGKVEIKLIE